MSDDPAEQNARLRLALRAQRQQWNAAVPSVITREVARTVFDRFLADHPQAAPEVIAIELVARADSWEEVAAVQAELGRVLASSSPADPSAAAPPSTAAVPA